MKNEDLEKYIGELSPELQEKARQCKTKEELNALLAENDAELSEDALQAVAGGCLSEPKCEKCGNSMEWREIGFEGQGYWRCPRCR